MRWAALLVVLAGCGRSTPRGTFNFVGDWRGEIEYAGIPHSVCDVIVEKDGSFRASMDNGFSKTGGHVSRDGSLGPIFDMQPSIQFSQLTPIDVNHVRATLVQSGMARVDDPNHGRTTTTGVLTRIPPVGEHYNFEGVWTATMTLPHRGDHAVKLQVGKDGQISWRIDGIGKSGGRVSPDGSLGVKERNLPNPSEAFSQLIPVDSDHLLATLVIKDMGGVYETTGFFTRR